MCKAFGVRVKAVDLLSGHATTPRGCADAVLSAWTRREAQTTAAAAASAAAAAAAAVNVEAASAAASPAAALAASRAASLAAQLAALVVASAAVEAEASTGVAVASSPSSSRSSGRAAARAAATAPLPAGLELRYPSPRPPPARSLHSQRPSATPVSAGPGSPPTPGSRSLAACGPVLVTGGTGFLGAHFVVELLDAPEVTPKQEKKHDDDKMITHRKQ
jgi:hypothetical protein